MADVYVGRFNRYFEKLFNIKGGPAIVDVEPSIRGAIAINHPATEERYLVGVESFSAGGLQAAVAANKSAAMIRNPLGSNVILTLEKIYLASSVGMQINILVAGSNPADLANSVTNHARGDPRTRAFSATACSQDAPAADPGTGFLLLSVAFSGSIDIIQTVNQEIVLLPQIAMRVVGQTVNQNLVWSFWWRERPLETSELT